MVGNERDFSKLCVHRGFARLAPRYYARVIGDGIFQVIYTGFKKYLDPWAPSYSDINRKSFYISIGVSSLYSPHREEYFIPDRFSGGFRPLDFKDKKRYRCAFLGITEEYNIMESMGFDVLDTIDSQEKFLEWWSLIQTTADGTRIHDPQLIIPFLLCGQLEEAKAEIIINHTHLLKAKQRNQTWIRNGHMSPDGAYEERLHRKIEENQHLWNLCNEYGCDLMNQYIAEKYTQNIAWIRKYGIPVEESHTQRTLGIQ